MTIYRADDILAIIEMEPGEWTARKLAEDLGRTTQAINCHLRKLRAAGLLHPGRALRPMRRPGPVRVPPSVAEVLAVMPGTISSVARALGWSRSKTRRCLRQAVADCVASETRGVYIAHGTEYVPAARPHRYLTLLPSIVGDVTSADLSAMTGREQHRVRAELRSLMRLGLVEVVGTIPRPRGRPVNIYRAVSPEAATPSACSHSPARVDHGHGSGSVGALEAPDAD